MRYESSVTSLSWIPSEAVTGVSRAAFDSGFTHYDDPPPAELGDIEELRAADRFRFANVLRAWIEVDDSGHITGGGYGGGGLMGATTLQVAGLRHTFQAVSLPDIQRPPESEAELVDALRPDDRGPDRHPRPAAGAAAAVHPVAGAAGVDHAVAHPARRRPGRVRGHRGQPVPPALDLRRRRAAGPQVRPDRLRQLGPGVVRPPHSLGRRGFPGPGHRGRDRAGAEPVRAAHARRGQAADQHTWSPGPNWSARATSARTSTWSSTGSSGSSTTANGWRSTDPGRCSASGPRWRAAARTATLVAVTKCRVAAVPAVQLDLSDLAELATGHRREEGVRG